MWFWVAVAVFVGAVAYAVVTVTGSGPTALNYEVTLFLLGAAVVIALAGWWRERSKLSAVEEDARQEHERLEGELNEREKHLEQTRDDLASTKKREETQRQEREQVESRLKGNEQELNRERYLRKRSEQARESEKDWRQELHNEVMRLSNERGALGSPEDVPEMVLQLAITLVGAEKGLLLSRKDRSGDGKLDLIAAEGFENAPVDNILVQRFANEVIERDRTVREKNLEGERENEDPAADGEINNLVAIPIYLRDEFDGVVVCANNPNGFDDYDDEVLLAVGDHAGAALQNARLQGELRTSYLATVGALAEAIEVKDPLVRGHSEDVSRYVGAVASRLDLPPNRREELIFGSLLHDVGKIGISERILLKPTKLTSEERSVIELHPRIGCRLVEQVPALRPIAPAVLHHHERFDGEGYPLGLRGEQIPLEARIICVADSFSAMVSARPYREPMSTEDACEELERCAGTQFDPEVVRVFVEEVKRNPLVLIKEASAARDPELEVLRDSDGMVLGQGPLSTIDNLTLLYTRRHLHEVARAEAQRSEIQGISFGVILVELTGIDEVNKRMGYFAGDEEIRGAARTLQEFAADVDGTACRYGGNRLALIVPGIEQPAADLLSAEILAELRDVISARVAAAAYHPGNTGDAVIVRARTGLEYERP